MNNICPACTKRSDIEVEVCLNIKSKGYCALASRYETPMDSYVRKETHFQLLLQDITQKVTLLCRVVCS